MIVRHFLRQSPKMNKSKNINRNIPTDSRNG
jgi:hypothetical protein